MNFLYSLDDSFKKLIRHTAIFLLIPITASLTACGGGSGGGSSSGGGSASLSGNTSVTANALPELISSEDSSVLRTALANGQDLTRTLLSTTYYCYGKQSNDLSIPIVTITTDGSNYTTTLNGAEGETGQWSYLGEDYFGFQSVGYTEFQLELTPYGQVLNWVGEDNQALADSCYQEGAAHEFALQRYEMNEPATGDYQCQALATGGAVGTLNIQADGNYSVDGSSGSFITQGVVSASYDESTSVGFTSGPFADMIASYVEYPDSGYQEMFFEDSTSFTSFAGAGSSSTATMICFRKGTPNPFKQYGTAAAQEPALPSMPLSGLYAINASVLSPTVNTNSIYYVDFRPNGYVYAGVPFEGGADCTLTTPGGLPYCATYQYDGTILTLDAPGETTEETFAPSSTGLLTTFDGTPVELVTSISPNSILGDWVYEDTDAGNLAACVVGFCSGSSFKSNVTFRSDGTFESDSDSFGFTSANLDVVSSFGQSESSTYRTGTYTLNGNFLTMEFANGHSNTQLVHFGFDNTILAIGEQGFRRPL